MVLLRQRNAPGPLRSDLRRNTRHGERDEDDHERAGPFRAGRRFCAAPASADYRIPSVVSPYVDKYVGSGNVEGGRYVKLRRFATQDEYIADSKPVGTSSWWQQMDREQRGGRR